MVEIIRKIIVNVLTALYQPFGFSVILAILFMCTYMFAKEYGWKEIMKRWVNAFKTDANFCRGFFLVFYTAMILFKTLLNRDMWANPLSDVMGVWGLYNQNGELTTEIVENLALFVPFTVLFLWSFQEKLIGQKVKLFISIWKTIQIAFLSSMTIEFLQLFLRLGTFQLSDLFYNTLGGFIGGLIYWCGYKITHRKKKEKDITDTP